MKAKTFDCVDMKRRGAEHVQRQVAELSPEEELEFWRKQTNELRRLQEQRREKQAPREG